MSKSKKLNVKGTEITVIKEGNTEFISLTDMTKGFENGSSLIDKWIRNKNTLEYLSVWEEMHNSLEFEGIKNEAGLNRFAISIKQWTAKTNATGIKSKAG